MPINRGPDTPPPMIGKIGRYTVFITPPATPTPSAAATPDKAVPAPPVQVPPLQFEKPAAPSDGSGVFGFFWNAIAKVQNAHSSLDEHLAHWFGLNQSKYQWALDDYYENKGVDNEDIKAKEVSSRIQSV